MKYMFNEKKGKQEEEQKLTIYQKYYIKGYQKGRSLFFESVAYTYVLKHMYIYCRTGDDDSLPIPLCLEVDFKKGIRVGYKDAERDG